MLDILKKLNAAGDRSLLIGRNALNFHHNAAMGGKGLFSTDDFDLVCPSIEAAHECRVILEAAGFIKAHSTFTHDAIGQIDILLADPQFPPHAVIEDYLNLPQLRPLWEARENHDGILTPSSEKLIQTRLLYQRDNFGKDAEAIGVYFELHSDRLKSTLNALSRHENADERDKMLYALYQSIIENEMLKREVEQAMLADIEKTALFRSS